MSPIGVNAKRRNIVKALPLALGSAVIGPRRLFACSDPQSPDIFLLDEFSGTVGGQNWTHFAFDLLQVGTARDGRQAAPSLQTGEEWTERISLATPKLVENPHVFPITAAFDDSALADGYWCSGLFAILESELQVIDPRDRYMSVKALQLLFRTNFAEKAAPRMSVRIKLASKYSRIGVVARVETPEGDILNIPRDFKLPDVYGCGWDRIYATSAEEVKRLKNLRRE